MWRRSRRSSGKYTGLTRERSGCNSVTSIVRRDRRLAAVDGSSWRVDQLASLIAHELEESMRVAVLVLVSTAAFAQQKGNCTPPPSALGPVLPAKLLPGMGTAHLKIDVEPGGAAVLRPGAGADALVLGAGGGAVVRAGGGARSGRRCRSGASMVAAGDWRPRFQLEDNDRGLGNRDSPPITPGCGAEGGRAERERDGAGETVHRGDHGPARPGRAGGSVRQRDARAAGENTRTKWRRGSSCADDHARICAAGEEAEVAGLDGSGGDPARAAAEGAGSSGVHPTSSTGSRARRSRRTRGRAARNTALVPNIPHAAHAGPHLLADGAVGRRSERRSTRRRPASASG
jgi:hypothetical protein